jgi:hypothetical protein
VQAILLLSVVTSDVGDEDSDPERYPRYAVVDMLGQWAHQLVDRCYPQHKHA